MKQTPQELFEQLSKEFGPKKSKEVINEELGKVVELKPLAKLESTVKDPFWTKFESYLAENSLKPLVNTEEKTNTKEQEEKIKALSTKVAGTVENIDSHNYNYDPSVNNINNVNAQEMLNGIQCEINYNKELTLDEAKELAVKNLAKDPLHYVKEGQFGVKGLGYTEAKVQVNDGETYGGSGYSEKIKEGSDEMELVKESKNKDCGCDKETISESLGQVVTTGNPNSLAAMSGQVIRQMMAEKEGVEEDYHNPPNEPSDLRTNFFKKGATKDGDEMDEEKKLPMDEVDTMEAKGKDMDGDGDIDSDDYLAARDKAIKKAMAKKAKKESIDSKLAEIGKAGEITKMEAQLEFLSNYINEKIDRVSSINEDDNLKELVDKSKMKAMQREIKLLEKRKSKMEKMYEKMTGTKRKTGIVDEMDAVSWNEKNNPTRNRAVGEREPKKVGQSTSDYAINESKTVNEAKFPSLKLIDGGSKIIDPVTKQVYYDSGDTPEFLKLMDRALKELPVAKAFGEYLRKKNITKKDLTDIGVIKRTYFDFQNETEKGSNQEIKNRLKAIDYFAGDEDRDWNSAVKDLANRALRALPPAAPPKPKGPPTAPPPLPPIPKK